MKLLLLCLLFGAVLAQTRADQLQEKPNEEVEDPEAEEMEIPEPESVDETDLSEAEEQDNGERAKRSTCPPNRWYPYKGRRYMFVSSATHWAHAQRLCQNMSATLASVHNSAVNNFLKLISGGRVAWIGLSDGQINNWWLWINGNKLVYAYWCRGEPNGGGGEACALINWKKTGCWNDGKCTNRYPYICETK